MLMCAPLRRAQIYALGFVSVFDQITESLPEDERKQIFRAYIDALGDKPEKFRKDAELLEKEASALPGPEALIPDANGTALQVRQWQTRILVLSGRL